MTDLAGGRRRRPVVLAYERTGQGPPLIVLNGFAGTRADWDPAFVAGLGEAYEAILVDNRGLGESSGVIEPFTIEDLAGDVAALIEALKLKRPAVLGWSMGGCIALALALSRPDLVGGLILLATTAGGRGAESVSSEALDDLSDCSIPPRDQASKVISYLFTPRRAKLIDEEFGDVVADARAALDPGVVALQRRALDEWDRAGVSQRLGEISVPALIATGDADRVIPPSNSSILAAGITRAWFADYRDSGHAFMADYPDSVARLVAAFAAFPR